MDNYTNQAGTTPPDGVNDTSHPQGVASEPQTYQGVYQPSHLSTGASQESAQYQANQPIYTQPTGYGNHNSEPPRKKKGGGSRIVAMCVAFTLFGAVISGTLFYLGSQWKNSSSIQPSKQITTQSAAQQATQKAVEQATATKQSRKAFSMEDFTRIPDNGDKKTLTASEIYEQAGPSVVSVRSKVSINQGGRNYSDIQSGSGVIFSSEGYVFTNQHVVEQTSGITIITGDGIEHEAELLGSDPRTDLAVLKFDNSDGIYKPAIMGDSDQVKIGEYVVAIGNPLGELANSLTVGVISGMDRNIDMQNGNMNFLQTTASISPGNSGGALIDSFGEVIGITTAKSLGQGVEGIGYAIPINEALPVFQELITNGYVTGRPVIGIAGKNITEEMAQLNNIPEGVYITGVEKDSAADKAQLLVGDIIISIDGQKVSTISDINTIKKEMKAGQTILVEYYRKGEKSTVSLTLTEEKPVETAPQEQQDVPQEQFPFEDNNQRDPYSNLQPMDPETFFQEFFGN